MATQSSGATYFPQQDMLPSYLQQLVKSLNGNAKADASQYNDFISNPTASPLYQNQLSGLLSALAPSEKQATTNLGDAFRAAGNMSSGQYGVANANLQGDQLRNRQTLASQLLGQMFPQMQQALMQPQQLAAQLASILKLQQQYGGVPDTTINNGGSYSGGNPDQGFLSQYQANGAGNPYDPFSGANFASSQNLFASPAPTAPTFASPTTPIGDGGSTMFMPGGNFVSGSNTSAGLYNPDAAGAGGAGGMTAGDWAQFMQNIE